MLKTRLAKIVGMRPATGSQPIVRFQMVQEISLGRISGFICNRQTRSLLCAACRVIRWQKSVRRNAMSLVLDVAPCSMKKIANHGRPLHDYKERSHGSQSLPATWIKA